MGVFWATIPASLQEWILEQKVFWVASAPLSGDGHINISPKGGSYFGIIDESTFWFMDLTGSGAETTSHLHEAGNGRITVMFNAFKGAPKIVRLWGKGTVYENGTKEFSDFVTRHSVKTIPGSRSIIVVDVHQAGSSCGFSVPFYDFVDFRPTLNNFFAKKAAAVEAGDEKESMDRYWAYKNSYSIDGLPAMKRGYQISKREKIAPMKKMVGPHAPTKPRTAPNGVALGILAAVAIISFILGFFVALYGPQLSDAFSEGLLRSSTTTLRSIRHSILTKHL